MLKWTQYSHLIRTITISLLFSSNLWRIIGIIQDCTSHSSIFPYALYITNPNLWIPILRDTVWKRGSFWRRHANLFLFGLLILSFRVTSTKQSRVVFLCSHPRNCLIWRYDSTNNSHLRRETKLRERSLWTRSSLSSQPPTRTAVCTWCSREPFVEFAFCIKTNEEFGKDFVVCANSDEDRKEWIDAILAARDGHPIADTVTQMFTKVQDDSFSGMSPPLF